MEKIAVLFPSQKAAYHQMGKTLYDNYSGVKKLFLIANQEFNCRFEDYIFENEKNELSRWELRVAAVFLTSVAFYNTLINTYNFMPNYYIGDGVGKLTALACAGVIEFEDAIRYLSQATSFLKENKIADEKQMSEIQKQKLVEQFKSVPIRVKEAQQNVIEETTCIPWSDIDYFIDVGPSREAGKNIKEHSEQHKICYLDFLGDGYYSLAIFQSKKLFNQRYLLRKMLAVAITGENENFNEKEYSTGVLESYSKIKTMCEKYSGIQSIPSHEEILEAKDYLIKIMKTKGMDQLEVTERLKQLEAETLCSL